MELPGNRLVIGLDYGTTYSGVAFAFVQGNQVQDRIQQIEDWPGERVRAFRTEKKVPSEISYSAALGGERQWGYDISESSLVWQWTKMELDEQERPDELRLILEAVIGMKNLDISQVGQSSNQALAYSRPPEGIVADYLTRIREYLVEKLQLLYDAMFPTLAIDLVVTVPAVWSDRAKDRTCHALSEAGFDNTKFPGLRRTILMSEPEAAALFTAQWLTLNQGPESLVMGDCFVLCDAGGGTVDLISYRVRQVVPSLELEEIAIGTGDKCGATFIDRRFKQWTKDRIGTEVFQEIFKSAKEAAIGSHTTVQPKMGEFMFGFEAIKRGFDGRPVTRYMPLPLPERFAEISDDPERGILNGELRITDRDLEPMFAPSVGRTLELIEGQVVQARLGGFHPKYIILCGGFAQSPLLQRQVRLYARENNIRTKVFEESWLAVALGAVTKGCEQETQNHIYMRNCRRHYGVSTSQPFSSYKHSESDAYFDPFTREKRATKQMSWLIKKGDALLSNAPKHASIDISRKFGVRDDRIFKTCVVSCHDDNVPQRYEDVPDNTSVSSWLVYDLTNVDETRFRRARIRPLGQPYFIANFTIEIKIGTQIQFKVFLKGRMEGDVEEISSITL